MAEPAAAQVDERDAARRVENEPLRGERRQRGHQRRSGYHDADEGRHSTIVLRSASGFKRPAVDSMGTTIHTLVHPL